MVLAGRMSLIMPQSWKLDKSTPMFDGCPIEQSSKPAMNCFILLLILVGEERDSSFMDYNNH
jgi:hypothetical protein